MMACLGVRRWNENTMGDGRVGGCAVEMKEDEPKAQKALVRSQNPWARTRIKLSNDECLLIIRIALRFFLWICKLSLLPRPVFDAELIIFNSPEITRIRPSSPNWIRLLQYQVGEVREERRC